MSSFARPTRPNRVRFGVRPFRPAAERLEDRVVPDVVLAHWIGGSGNWSDPTHWDIGVVPDNTNTSAVAYHVVIDRPDADVVVTLDQAVTVQNLTNAETLRVTVPASAVTAETVNRGVLEVEAATLTLRGAVTNAGSVTVQDAGLLVLVAATVANDGHSLTADGGTIAVTNSSVTGGTLAVTDDAASFIHFEGNVPLTDVAWDDPGAGEFQIHQGAARLGGDFANRLPAGHTLVVVGGPNVLGLILPGGTFRNDGTIVLRPSTPNLNVSAVASLFLEAPTVLTGSGTLDVVAATISGAPDATLTVEASQTVRVHRAAGLPSMFGVSVPTTNRGSFVFHDGIGPTFGKGLTNEGLYDGGTGTTSIQGPLTLAGPGTFRGTAFLHESLLGDARDGELFSGNGTLQFFGLSSPEEPHRLEVMGRDLGTAAAGFRNNFVVHELAVGGQTYLRLVDESDNAPGTEPEALYLKTLFVPSGATLDLNGHPLYARAVDIAGTVIGGAVVVVPDRRPLVPGLNTRGHIEVVGEADEWTFLGQAGQVTTVSVGVGGGRVPQGVEVRLLDPDGNVLASQSNLVDGSFGVTLRDVRLPSDGTYVVEVHAPPQAPTHTGVYQITAALTVSSPTLFGISSDHGGNTGRATVRLAGALLPSGPATVTLRTPGQPDIVAEATSVLDGELIPATFDLTGAAPGARDVVATLSDGQTLTLDGAFTVEAGAAARLWVEMLGRPTVRAGREATVQVVVGNAGNVDWDGLATLALFVPEGVGPVTVSYNQFEVGQFSPEVPLPLGLPPATQLPAGKLVGLFNLPLLGPSDQGVYSFSFVPSGALAGNLLSQIIQVPGLPRPGFPLPDPDLDLGEAIQTLINQKELELGLEPPTLEDAFKEALTDTLEEVIKEQIKQLALDPVLDLIQQTLHLPDFVRLAVEQALDRLETAFSAAADAYRAVWNQATGQATGDVFDSALYANWQAVAPPDPPSEFDIDVVDSQDPNDKQGPRGTGPARHVPGAEPLGYTVFFENLPTATAPAQEVLIRDQLDLTKVDPNTFRFGPISFGDRRVIPPGGSQRFQTTVDLRPDAGLLVLIDAQFDAATGLITWRFTSVDPATGNFPDDPLAGFLPPNVTAPEGEGSVLYTIRLRPGLPTGTEVRNQAEIIFDTNAPIETPEWLNTLDNTPPTSRVLPLTATQTASRFEVRWEGGDAGAGIADYTIFVSADGGPWTAWLRDTTATSMTFEGRPGSTYQFVSVARDRAGNQELGFAQADAGTAVTMPPPRPDRPPTVVRVGLKNGPGGRSTMRRVIVTFSEVVALDKNAFEVVRKGTKIRATVATRVVGGRTVAVLSFRGRGAATLWVRAAAVTAGGRSLDGNGDGLAGDDVRARLRPLGDRVAITSARRTSWDRLLSPP